LRPGGIGLLRVDLSALALELGGRRLPIEELYLLLLLTLTLILLFLFLTLAFGRVWCGWGCPQTALVDLTEGVARRLGLTVSAGRIGGPRRQMVLLHGFYLLLALLLGYSLLAYFLPPPELLRRCVAGRLGWSAGLTLSVSAGVIYLDLIWMRRLFCREFCPYGRFQAALIDAGTLTLRFHPAEAHRCIRCNACVRACPVGIDIRNGEQIECINCGRCLDACRRVMQGKRQAGIIRYTFGLTDQGLRALLNPRLLLLGTALFIVGGILLVATLQRPTAALKFGRSATASRPLGAGRFAVFYTAYLHNRGKDRLQAQLVGVLPDTGRKLELLGPIDGLILEPGAHRKFDFAIVLTDTLPRPAIFELHLLGNNHDLLALATGSVPAGEKIPAQPSRPNPEH
jgi:cytochrome c oxidase accessory protein FixG